MDWRGAVRWASPSELGPHRENWPEGCGAPDGGFCPFPNFEAVLRPGEGSGELASALLGEQRVATVPGVAFGHDTHLRLSYATSDEMVDEGVGRIQRFFAA